jgi:hypothetical protein
MSASAMAPARPRRALAALLGVIAVSAASVLAAVWAARPLAHDDLFGHLRTGEWILAQHAVPHRDLFSYTRPGAPWVSHEWGFSVLVTLVDRFAGLFGLRVLAALLTLAIGAATARRALLRMGAASLAAVPREGGWLVRPVFLLPALLAVATWAIAPELFLRAALLGELMLALLLLALDRYAETGGRGVLAVIVVLFLLWGNVHASALFGLGVLAVPVFEAAAGRWLVPRRPAWAWLASRHRGDRLVDYLMVLVAALAAALLNPNGAAALLYPLQLRHLLLDSGIAWDLGQFAASSPTQNTGLLLLVVLLLAGALPLSRLRLLSLTDLVLSLTFLGLTFRTPRFGFDFAVVVVPLIALLLSRRPRTVGAAVGGPAPPAGSARLLATHAAAVVLVALLAVLAGAAVLGRRRGDIDERFPRGATDLIAQQGWSGHLFHNQNYGGFLSWRLRTPIFWDGRNEVFASLVREVATTPFAELARRYRIEALLLTEREYDDLRPELATNRWGLVYWDDFVALYLRREPRFATALGQAELRLFPPFGGRPGMAALAADRPAAAAVRKELEAVLARNPRIQRALYFAGLLDLYQGDVSTAERRLSAALAVRPNEQVTDLLSRIATAKAGRPAGGR